MNEVVEIGNIREWEETEGQTDMMAIGKAREGREFQETEQNVVERYRETEKQM